MHAKSGGRPLPFPEGSIGEAEQMAFAICSFASPAAPSITGQLLGTGGGPAMAG
jgi:hypothetical protein